MTWRTVPGAAALWPGEMAGVTCGPSPVLVVHAGGALRVYPDRCLHQGVALSEGRLDGDVLTCRAHGWQYDACTGAGINPAGVALRRLPLRIEGDRVAVDMDGDG